MFARVLSCAAAMVAITAMTSGSHAQDWPKEPVKIVVSAAAGGPIDVFGRIMLSV